MQVEFSSKVRCRGSRCQYASVRANNANLSDRLSIPSLQNLTGGLQILSSTPLNCTQFENIYNHTYPADLSYPPRTSGFQCKVTREPCHHCLSKNAKLGLGLGLGIPALLIVLALVYWRYRAAQKSHPPARGQEPAKDEVELPNGPNAINSGSTTKQ